MKKLLYLVFILTFLGLVLLSCEKASNPVENQLDTAHETGSLAKGKPSRTPPVIDYLKIGGVKLIDENGIVLKNVDAYIDLSDGKTADIEYHVTSKSDITRISLHLHYDMNLNYNYWSNSPNNDVRPYPDWVDEMGPWVFRHEEEWSGSNDTDALGGIANWDGIALTLSPYYDYYPSNTFQLFDEVATYNGETYGEGFSGPEEIRGYREPNPDPAGEADHYGIIFYADAEGTGMVEHTWVWIKAPRKPEGTFYVEEVTIDAAGKKATASINVVDQTRNPLDGVYAYGYWSGNSSIRRGGPSVGGIVTVGAPTGKWDWKNPVFTVKSVRKADWAYYPQLNNKDYWTWPERPYGPHPYLTSNQ